MNIIELETPLSTEKYAAPPFENKEPFYITEYGRTFKGVPCYQIRMDSPIGCVQYVISGGGILICNEKIYSVSAGDTFLIPEGSNHTYFSNPDNQFERIWINFKGELAEKLLEVYKLEKTVVFRKTDALPILARIQETCKATKHPKEYQNVTSRLFLELVQFLAEHCSDEEDSSSVEQIRAYIDCNITRNLKLADIAVHFTLSKEHIIRQFKEKYGITPHQYIMQSRIRLAMILLKTTDKSVEEIADMLGFSDAKHLTMQFKKMLHYTPTQYRLH